MLRILLKSFVGARGASSAETAVICALILPLMIVSIHNVGNGIARPFSKFVSAQGGGSSSTQNINDSQQPDDWIQPSCVQNETGQEIVERCTPYELDTSEGTSAPNTQTPYDQ